MVSYTLADGYYEVHLLAMTQTGRAQSWAAHHDVDVSFLESEEARRRLSFEEYRWALDRAVDPEVLAQYHSKTARYRRPSPKLIEVASG